MERFKDKLPIGMQVLYYPRADLNQKPTYSAGPLLGLVHRCDDGMCDLIVFDWHGKSDLKKAVYHTSHPDLYDMHGQVTGAGYRAGCWEFTDASRREWETYHAKEDKSAKKPVKAAV